MSCCPEPEKIFLGTSFPSEQDYRETERMPGESAECYMRRAGNPTGKHDDATKWEVNRIETLDIPLTGGDEAKDVIFRMTPGSKVPTSWTLVVTPPTPTLVFTSMGATAKLNGKFPKEAFGKTFKFQLTAKNAEGDIDTRAYTISPAKAGANEIRFVHPMPHPNVRCNSPFSDSRMHPIHGVKKPHNGADFVVSPAPPADVVSAANGEVIFADPAGSAGNMIRIKHYNTTGKHLCTTVYMHLAKIYVDVGQKVVAGQKIGKEGSTGGSTGPHLHFECRLPNNTPIDPIPLIKGTVFVARETNPDNSPNDETLEAKTSNAALTAENVAAKEGGCPDFGPDYSKRPQGGEPSVDLPPGITDLFEKAWFFTMSWEVGPHWKPQDPSDPEVAQGLFETQVQRRKVGYKGPDFPGGITKFGIASNPRPRVKVPLLNYAQARSIGYNEYWKLRSVELASTKPKSAVVLYELAFLHGSGSVRSMLRDVDMNLADGALVDALIGAQQKFIRGINSATYDKGWMRRSESLHRFVKALT